MSSKAVPTVDELIGTLKKTLLPTVVCEGSDDMIVYRRLEDSLSHLGVSVLPAGGRTNVLAIYDRRGEIPNAVQLAFLADRDTWVNVGVPPQYVDVKLVLTDGYSIENDVYRDGQLESLLAGPESAQFQAELGQFIDWYALALSRHLANGEKAIALHPEKVLSPTQRAALLALEPGETYPGPLRVLLTEDYAKLLRGKSLLALLLRNTNRRRGRPNHSVQGLLETVAARPGQLLTKTAATVEAVFR